MPTQKHAPDTGKTRLTIPVSASLFCTFSSKKTNPAFFQTPCQTITFSYSCSYSFTGKELDPETGYSYFGARYLESALTSLWLSVDPMADKYPSISPYAYCAWNPMKLVDPNGEEIGDFYNERGLIIGNDGKNDGKKYLVMMVRPNSMFMDSDADNIYFGITKSERKKTEAFIRKNSGDENAFTEDCIAYKNSILIPTTKDEFAEMRNLCKDSKHAVYEVEYGGLKGEDGNIYGGNTNGTPEIAKGTKVKIRIHRIVGKTYRYWFHHHIDDGDVCQMPSTDDLNTFRDLIGYTISFRNNLIYVSKDGKCQGYITFEGSAAF